MTNKKRRRRPPAKQRPPENEPARLGGANLERRERKEEARRRREEERHRVAQRARVRRSASILAVGAIVFTVVLLLNRTAPPDRLSDAAQAVAQAAGCTGPNVVLASEPPSGQHLDPGQTTTYTERPATSGLHDPTPLPSDPNVYTTPVDETQAVHFMEHAGILLYYRQTGTGAVPQGVVDELAAVADSKQNTILAPFPELPAGKDLAFATWNRLLTCPGSTTAAQAGQIARAFVDAYVCTSAGPEPSASDEC